MRAEVEELWGRRRQPGVIALLSPFMVNEKDSETRMLFHNAVMRQKYSLLTEDEKLNLQAWIDDDAQKRWDIIQHPWKATLTDDTDELTAENQYVQK